MSLEEGESDPKKIEEAYQAAAQRLKSYRGQVDEASWREAVRRIRQAWGVLSDPEQKRELDARFGIFADPIDEDPLDGLLPAADPLVGPIRLGGTRGAITAIEPGIPEAVRPEPATGVAGGASFGPAISSGPVVAVRPAARRRHRSKVGTVVLAGTIVALAGFSAVLGYFLIFGQGRVEVARGGGQVTIRTSSNDDSDSSPTVPSPPRRDERPENVPTRRPDPVMGRLGQGKPGPTPDDRLSLSVRPPDLAAATEPEDISTGTEPEPGMGTEPAETGAPRTATEPAGTEPAGTEPAETGAPRTATEPAGTEPAGTEPAGTGPEPNSQVETEADAAGGDMLMNGAPSDTEEVDASGVDGDDAAAEVVARGEQAFTHAVGRFASADWVELSGAVQAASQAAVTATQRRDARDLAELARHATRYREGLRRAMDGLGGGNELKVGPLDVIVVEASADELTIRRGARNLTYGIDELPPIVADALSDLSMPANDPATRVGRWVYQSIAPTFDSAYRDEAVARLRELDPAALAGSSLEGTEPERLADLIERVVSP